MMFPELSHSGKSIDQPIFSEEGPEQGFHDNRLLSRTIPFGM